MPPFPRGVIWLCVKHAVTEQSYTDVLSRVQLFVTPWSLARQAPLSMGFSRQEYWSGLPCPPQRDLPNPEIEPTSVTSPALADAFSTTRTTWGAHVGVCRVASVVFDSAALWTVIRQAPLSMGISGENTGVCCHAFLQGIFPNQGSSSHLSHLLNWQAGSLPLVPPGKPTENANIDKWLRVPPELKGLSL